MCQLVSLKFRDGTTPVVLAVRHEVTSMRWRLATEQRFGLGQGYVYCSAS
jgi:hypothetical protein